jgi:uncharacterized protein (TIGR02246 family)
VDELTSIAIKQACADLITRYAIAVNTWDIDAFVKLFAADAVWYRPASGEMHGHPEIRAFMESQSTDRVLRHVNGGALIDVVDESHATGWSQTTVYEAPMSALPAKVTGPDMVVEYRDRYARHDGGWLIARRDTTIVFSASS